VCVCVSLYVYVRSCVACVVCHVSVCTHLCCVCALFLKAAACVVGVYLTLIICMVPQPKFCANKIQIKPRIPALLTIQLLNLAIFQALVPVLLTQTWFKAESRHIMFLYPSAHIACINCTSALISHLSS
jgi:hypothetical protein